MGEPNDRQTATEQERREHDDARFAHFEEAQARENQAQALKTKIIGGLVAVGALAWAWVTLR